MKRNLNLVRCDACGRFADPTRPDKPTGLLADESMGDCICGVCWCERYPNDVTSRAQHRVQADATPPTVSSPSDQSAQRR